MRYEDEEKEIMGYYDWLMKKKYLNEDPNMCLLTTLKSFFSSNELGNATSVLRQLYQVVSIFEGYESKDTTSRDAFIDTLIAVLQTEKSTPQK